MNILWTYFKPFRYWILLSLVLAGIGQLLSLYDPIIFGRIIDNYTLNPSDKPRIHLYLERADSHRCRMKQRILPGGGIEIITS